MSADLGVNPSYTWRSLHGVLWVIEKGSRWIVGDGNSLKAWKTRWSPRPDSFLPISWDQGSDEKLLVAELIDKEAGCWREDVVR